MTKPIVFAVVATCVLALGSASTALAQPQSKDQQKCLNTLNKDGAGVAKAQGKEYLGCVSNKGKGKLVGTADACLTADPKLKVQKKKDKTSADEVKKCTTAPDFGYTGATAVNDAAMQAELDLVEDIFGNDLDGVVIDCDTSKDGCKCQQQVTKAIEKQVQTKIKEFLKCKKTALKNGASSTADLNDCVNDAGTPGSLAADTKDKISKGVEKIEKAVVKKCDEKGVTAGAFPGDCTGLTGATLAACLDVLVECRVCQMLNEMDALFVNCDLFDDNTANGSCASGSGPTPTPTLTPTPTPTVTPTVTPTPCPTPGAVFEGAIARTSGLWNYDGVNGLPGGEIECDDHFPGSHVCTYAELSSASCEGQLVGATDVNALPVNTFWAVIPAADPFDQCISTAGTIRWFYATVHTGSLGNFATLNNGTGALGPVAGPVSCAGNSFSVGCCQ